MGIFDFFKGKKKEQVSEVDVVQDEAIKSTQNEADEDDTYIVIGEEDTVILNEDDAMTGDAQLAESEHIESMDQLVENIKENLKCIDERYKKTIDLKDLEEVVKRHQEQSEKNIQESEEIQTIEAEIAEKVINEMSETIEAEVIEKVMDEISESFEAEIVEKVINEMSETIEAEVIEKVINNMSETVEAKSTEAVIDEVAMTEDLDVTEKLIDEVIEELETTEDFIDEVIEELAVTEDIVDEAVEELTEEPAKKVGFFGKIKTGISKTREAIFSNVESVLNSFTTIDEELFEELEEVLILSDIGVETSTYIIDQLRIKVKKEGIKEVSDINQALKEIISELLEKNNDEFELKPPTVILVIGVNGVGKTTTIGKLANNFKKEGNTVMLAAADTFRAAAIDQLEVWAKRSNVPLIRQQENGDPGAVVYDACQSAKSKNIDVLLVDTAGRLQNKKNLMDELGKITRIINREHSNANIEVFLVLDSTTGQNALQQAKVFNEVANVTGLVLTKLDGTAKGGVIVAIKHELDIPVRYVGLGEKIDDLEKFDSEQFAKALLNL